MSKGPNSSFTSQVKMAESPMCTSFSFCLNTGVGSVDRYTAPRLCVTVCPLLTEQPYFPDWKVAAVSVWVASLKGKPALPVNSVILYPVPDSNQISNASMSFTSSLIAHLISTCLVWPRLKSTYAASFSLTIPWPDSSAMSTVIFGEAESTAGLSWGHIRPRIINNFSIMRPQVPRGWSIDEESFLRQIQTFALSLLL